MNSSMLEGCKGYSPDQVLEAYKVRGFAPILRASVGKGDFATYHYNTEHGDLMIKCTHRIDRKGKYIWSGDLPWNTHFLIQ